MSKRIIKMAAQTGLSQEKNKAKLKVTKLKKPGNISKVR
jgi:hypothetical protein